MALLNPNFKNKTSFQFWQDELLNTRRILHEIEKAILYFTQQSITSGGVQEYTIWKRPAGAALSFQLIPNM